MAIPVKNLMTEIDNLPGQEVAFTIGDPRWVMQSLADLYSNKELAVTREYSTNARDAHIEAGKADVPIQVTLPTLMDPYFTVQDFGIGMSEDDLTSVYTKFGDSTKRESNEFNGMLGFGSKSAIAYTNQFTVEAVKDGIKTIGVITRKPDYSIYLKIAAKAAVNEPNGVKITIPVSNHDEFKRKAQDFYRFWRPGTVLVDGVEPKQAVGEKIEDDLYFSPNPGVSYVVMGNVGYRIANPEALFRNAKMNQISFVAYVENGAVEFTPSREDLKYTDHTKKTLYGVITNVEAKILSEAKNQIASAKTASEAWTLWNNWGQKIGNQLFKDMEWQGKKFVHVFNTPKTVRYQVPSLSGYNPRYNTYGINHWEVIKSNTTLFITDFLTDANGDISVTASQKKKAREYFEHVGLKANHVLFMRDAPVCEWIPQANIITWEDLKAAVPKKVRVPGPPKPKRPKGLFDFYTINGKEWETPIPDGADVFYISAQDAKKYTVGDALKATNADASVVVVVLAINRIDKFKRDNFAARDFVEWAKKKVVINCESLIDDRTKLALNLGENTLGWVKALKGNVIDDPKWKLIAELVAYRKYSDKYEKNLELARCLGMRYDVKEYRAAGSDDTLLNAYPLLHKLSYWRLNLGDAKEIALYINAAYAAKKGKP